MGKTKARTDDDSGYVVKMPESDASTLCVSLHGVVSVEDYQKSFCEPLEAMMKSSKRYSMLMRYAPDYKGWSKEAADLSFQSIIAHGRSARKLAYVNPPEAKIFQLKVARELFGGEIRFFSENEFKEALKWVKS